jgi:electron transport complex protein RnfG
MGRVVRNMVVVHQARVSEGGKPVGFLVAVQGQAYHGPAVVLVGLDLGQTILGIRVIEFRDTPKIGGQALEESYWSQFSGKKAAANLLASQGDFDTISGASITADCIADMVKVASVEAAKLAAAAGGTAWTGGDDYPLNEHYLEE